MTNLCRLFAVIFEAAVILCRLFAVTCADYFLFIFFAPIFLEQNYAEFIRCCGEADLSGRIIEAELRRIYFLLFAVVVKPIRQAELLRIILDIFEAELRRIYLLVW